MGAAPASIAKAASLRQRPGWDQAQARWRPRSGRPRAGRAGRAARPAPAQDGLLVVGGLGVRIRIRRARACSTASAVAISTSPLAARSQPGGDARPCAGSCGRGAGPARRSGAVMTRACSCRWASVAASTAERRAVRRICSAARQHRSWAGPAGCGPARHGRRVRRRSGRTWRRPRRVGRLGRSSSTTSSLAARRCRARPAP